MGMTVNRRVSGLGKFSSINVRERLVSEAVKKITQL